MRTARSEGAKEARSGRQKGVVTTRNDPVARLKDLFDFMEKDRAFGVEDTFQN